MSCNIHKIILYKDNKCFQYTFKIEDDYKQMMMRMFTMEEAVITRFVQVLQYVGA